MWNEDGEKDTMAPHNAARFGNFLRCWSLVPLDSCPSLVCQTTVAWPSNEISDKSFFSSLKSDTNYYDFGNVPYSPLWMLEPTSLTDCPVLRSAHRLWYLKRTTPQCIGKRKENTGSWRQRELHSFHEDFRAGYDLHGDIIFSLIERAILQHFSWLDTQILLVPQHREEKSNLVYLFSLKFLPTNHEC